MRPLQINLAIHSITRTTGELLKGSNDALREQRAEQVFGMFELAQLLQAPARLTEFLDLHRAAVAGGEQADAKPAGLPSLIVLHLPPEFLVLCKADKVTPETVLKGFIADLCEIMNTVADPRVDGYSSNGSDERSLARAYYERVGYPYWHRE